MSAVEDVARLWHEGSDHARDGSPFGGYLCNCMRVAKRVTPMLAKVWRQGVIQGHDKCVEGVECFINPYEVDQ